VLNAKKSSIRSVITFIVSLSTSKHRKKKLLQTQEKWRKFINNNSNGGAIQGANYCFLKND